MRLDEQTVVYVDRERRRDRTLAAGRSGHFLDDAHLVPAIEPGRAAGARPGALATASDGQPAAWALVEILQPTPGDWFQGRSNLVQCGTGQRRDTVRDSVIPMVGVAPGVAVQPVTHVNQLFGDDELHRPRLILIDSFEVDQHGVIAGPAQEAVGTAKRRRHSAADPPPIRSAAGCHPKMIDGQLEQHTVVIDEFAQASIALIENQERFTSGSTRGAAACRLGHFTMSTCIAH